MGQAQTPEVENVARAIFETWSATPWDRASPSDQTEGRYEAMAAITAMAKLGWKPPQHA